MRKLILAVLFFCGTSAFAQTHTVNLSWTASVTAGVTSYNVYRATGSAASCVTPACVVVGSVTAPATSYSDSTAVAGAQYTYFATAVCPASGSACAGESGFSNSVAASIPPPPPPAPPGNLTITSIARSITNGVTTLSASWSDKPNAKTTYFLYKDNAWLTNGVQQNANGVYQMKWSGKAGLDSVLTLQVCDGNGPCQVRKI